MLLKVAPRLVNGAWRENPFIEVGPDITLKEGRYKTRTESGCSTSFEFEKT